MRFCVQELATRFDLEQGLVLSFVKKYLDRPQLEAAEAFFVEPEKQAELLLIISVNAAKCGLCSKTFSIEQSKCDCGRLLGRCPNCLRYTSFAMVNNRWFSRDEYRCGSCNSDVALCEYKDAKNCFRWALKVGTTWNSYCPTCTQDPERQAIARKNKDEYNRQLVQSMVDGAAKGLNQRNSGR